VDIGLAADLGTLTRVPRITGNDSLLRELCYTGRNFSSADAQALGLVSRVLPSPADTLAAAEALAAEIAGKSPVAVVGTKANLRYARDHTTKDALDYITTWCVVLVESMLVGVVVVASGSGWRSHPTRVLDCGQERGGAADGGRGAERGGRHVQGQGRV